MASIATATVKVGADTSGIIEAARIIAKHLTAMADELELAGREGKAGDDGD